MKLGLRPALVPALGMVVVCLMGVGSAAGQGAAGGQSASTQKPVMAEDVLKNVQVLRGIPLDEFMGTMGFFAAALSLNCTDCHVGAALDNWERYADDTPRKQTTRKMVLMVRAINQANFGGKREVTCYTCHRSSFRPKVTPSLAEQYGTPPPDDPDELESVDQAPAPRAPSADQILDTRCKRIFRLTRRNSPRRLPEPPKKEDGRFKQTIPTVSFGPREGKPRLRQLPYWLSCVAQVPRP